MWSQLVLGKARSFSLPTSGQATAPSAGHRQGGNAHYFTIAVAGHQCSPGTASTYCTRY